MAYPLTIQQRQQKAEQAAVVDLYEGTVRSHEEAAANALTAAEEALDSYTKLIEEAREAGVVFKPGPRLTEAADGCRDQLQSFYFGGES